MHRTRSVSTRSRLRPQTRRPAAGVGGVAATAWPRPRRGQPGPAQPTPSAGSAARCPRWAWRAGGPRRTDRLRTASSRVSARSSRVRPCRGQLAGAVTRSSRPWSSCDRCPRWPTTLPRPGDRGQAGGAAALRQAVEEGVAGRVVALPGAPKVAEAEEKRTNRSRSWPKGQLVQAQAASALGRITASTAFGVSEPMTPSSTTPAGVHDTGEAGSGEGGQGGPMVRRRRDDRDPAPVAAMSAARAGGSLGGRTGAASAG